MERKCPSCDYCSWQVEAEVGICRRFPPDYAPWMPGAEPCDSDCWAWPVVLKNEWCGEFRPKAQG